IQIALVCCKRLFDRDLVAANEADNARLVVDPIAVDENFASLDHLFKLRPKRTGIIENKRIIGRDLGFGEKIYFLFGAILENLEITFLQTINRSVVPVDYAYIQVIKLGIDLNYFILLLKPRGSGGGRWRWCGCGTTGGSGALGLSNTCRQSITSEKEGNNKGGGEGKVRFYCHLQILGFP